MLPYKKLREEMEKQKISANKLSLKAMISPANFSQAINGKMPMFPGWRKRLAEALGVSEKELFSEEENDEKGVE
jgi:transcriptional regulator with XRE-family HTH domain